MTAKQIASILGSLSMVLVMLPMRTLGAVYTALEGQMLPESLNLGDWIEAIRQSDADKEFGYDASLSAVDKDRAVTYWNANIRHDWNRALRWGIYYPYLFCKDQKDEATRLSGYDLLKKLEFALPEEVSTVINGPSWYCAFARTTADNAMMVDTSLFKVTPLLSCMKILQGSLETLEKNLESYSGFPSVTVQLCPGVVASDDIRSATTSLLDNDAVDGTTLSQRLAWWREARLDPESGLGNFTKTPREEFWEAAINAYDNKECDDTFSNRLIWEVDGLVSDSLINVQFNNSGATVIDKVCAYLLAAALTTSADVCTLETPQELETSNMNAQWMIQSNITDETPWFDVGLDGTGQVVTVSDTGIDTDNCYFRDASHNVRANQARNNNHRKIVEYDVAPGAVFGDQELGHGTHVVGSVLGQRSDDGVNPTLGMADGVAPGAKVAFVDIGDAEGNLFTPNDNSLLGAGRRSSPPSSLHSGSWGVPDLNVYTSQARNFDDFMFQNDDFLVFMAAGNGGRGDRAGSVGSPSTFKNGVTVGASHSCCEGLASGQRDMNHVADFSSRGPTADGRTKPDILAPGKFILSAGARPNENGECDPSNIPGAGGNARGVLSLQGTSMATPIAAGNAALVRQYFLEGFYPSGNRNASDAYNPSGALVKAVLMNGAQYLIGVDNGRSGVTPVSPYDNTQNFGRISLPDSLALNGTSNIQAVVWDRVPITPGEELVYNMTIDKSNGCSSTDFSVTLVWMESGSLPGCRFCVQNDLDLHVMRGGTKHFPNGRSSPDSTNNAERVQLADAVDNEEIFIHVTATNLAVARQRFALVTTACYGGVNNTLTSAELDDDNNGSGPNVMGIVIGVLVGVVAIGVAGYFLFRSRGPSSKQQEEGAPL